MHLPDGSLATLVLVDEVWADGLPLCSVCGTVLEDTFYRCAPCAAVICRRCLSGTTSVVECDCLAEIAVTGVQLAARRAAAARVS